MKEIFPLLKNSPLTQTLVISALILISIGILIKPFLSTMKNYRRELVTEFFASFGIALILGLIAVSIMENIDNKQKQAFEHKEYTLVKKDDKLMLNSKSKYLKSKELSVYSESDETIEVKYNDLFYKINKVNEKIIQE